MTLEENTAQGNTYTARKKTSYTCPGLGVRSGGFACRDPAGSPAAATLFSGECLSDVGALIRLGPARLGPAQPSGEAVRRVGSGCGAGSQTESFCSGSYSVSSPGSDLQLWYCQSRVETSH